MNETASSKQLMQKMNRLKVLDAIKRAQGITRPALARDTGLSLASITNIVTYLKAKDVVSEVEMEESGKLGRRAALLRYKYTAYDVVCVRVNTETITITLTDLSGTVKYSTRGKTPDDKPVFDTDHLKSEIKRFVKEHATLSTLAVGIAVSGLVLNDGDYVLSVGLKWEESYLRQRLEAELGMPVVVFNVSASNALFGCVSTGSENLDSLVFIDLDGGVGAKQICQGRVNRGAAGEIGHTTVEKDGELCFCGNRGCLELMCSPVKILASAKAVSGVKLAGLPQVFEVLKEDAAVRGEVDRCLEYLGIAVANIINVFMPEKIIINYAELYDYEYVHEYVMDCVKRRAHYASLGQVSFERICLDDNDKLIGIAQYIIDTIFDITFPGNIIE